MRIKRHGKGCICCDVNDKYNFGLRLSDYYSGLNGSCFPIIRMAYNCCLLRDGTREIEIFYCPWCGRRLKGRDKSATRMHCIMLMCCNEFSSERRIAFYKKFLKIKKGLS